MVFYVERRRTLRGHDYADWRSDKLTNWRTDGTVQLSNCLSVGQRAATRYPERFARIDGSNCSTVLGAQTALDSRLFPNSASQAAQQQQQRQQRAWEHAREEAQRRRERLTAAVERSLAVCAPVCVDLLLLIVSHCVIYYQQTAMAAMPVTSRESERASPGERHR